MAQLRPLFYLDVGRVLETGDRLFRVIKLDGNHVVTRHIDDQYRNANSIDLRPRVEAIIQSQLINAIRRVRNRSIPVFEDLPFGVGACWQTVLKRPCSGAENPVDQKREATLEGFCM